MPYTDHYEKYLNEIPENIEKCKETGDRIVFGYTSDLDVLLTYNEDEFNKLVDTYVKGDIYRDGDENGSGKLFENHCLLYGKWSGWRGGYHRLQSCGISAGAF